MYMYVTVKIFSTGSSLKEFPKIVFIYNSTSLMNAFFSYSRRKKRNNVELIWLLTNDKTTRDLLLAKYGHAHLHHSLCHVESFIVRHTYRKDLSLKQTCMWNCCFYARLAQSLQTLVKKMEFWCWQRQTLTVQLPTTNTF